MKTNVGIALLPLFLILAAHAEEKKGGVSELVGVVGVLGTMTVDATLGELLVRAYPAITLAKQNFNSIPAQVELSCDTYRSGASNHYVAAATACHIGYELNIH